MSGVLMELAEPWIKNAEIRGKQEGRQEGIQGTVDILHSLGHSDEEIKTVIMRKYAFSEEEAEKYLL